MNSTVRERKRKGSETLSACSETWKDSMMLSHIDAEYFSKENQSEEFTEKQIAARENKFVSWSRLFFVLALLFSGGMISVVAYFVGLKAEKGKMRSQFKLDALELIELSQQKVASVFSVLDTLSVTITSFAHQNASRNEGQPPGFYTLPDVEHHLGKAREVSRAFMIAYLPLVEEQDRDAWENYSHENQDWILDANELANSHELEPIHNVIWSYMDDESNITAANETNMHRRLPSRKPDCSGGSTRRLEDKVFQVEPRGNGRYSPVWQRSPPVEPNNTYIINYNMFDRPVFDNAVKFIESSRRAVFLDVCTQTSWFGAEDPEDGEIQTVVVQPVFEDFNRSSKIVGVVAAVLPWYSFFDDILSDGSHPALLVMSNTCDEEFSFRINGTQNHFEGMTDTHLSKFDKEVKNSSFADFANPANITEETGEYCIYTISVYPTQQMEDAYMGHESTLYVVVVVCIFLFTSFSFILYDCLVRLRQEKVVSTANQTQVLVSSLFPKVVQNEVLVAVNERKNSNNRRKSPQVPERKNSSRNLLKKNKRMSDTLATTLSSDEKDQKSIDYALKHTKPIANLYPETTIMFADIAGFTKWSSSRQPTEVFTLLENLYHAFDMIAHERGVFKVETIGDCYVAVCGLPNARSDHYLVMACFAIDCMRKIKEVLKDLEPTLGAGTMDLELRVGLHSGAVTAGVLRGEKARFQLFGDTMNTASRMESTGERGAIQCSQQTADLLIASGNSSWLTQREEKVIAKGKGELATFWLQIDAISKSNYIRRRVSYLRKLSLDLGGHPDDTVTMLKPPQFRRRDTC